MSCEAVNENELKLIEWTHVYFGECLYTNREVAAMIVGYCSVVCWLFAQLPQVIKNFRRKSTNGLSFGFIMIWLVGDVSNFLGCLLTNQMPFQKYLAMYFITVDFIMFWQMMFYGNGTTEVINSSVEENEPLIEAQNIERSYSLLSEQGLISTIVIVGLPSANALSIAATGNPSTQSNISFSETLGLIFAWISLVSYLSSRLPQIIQNRRQKSVEGLSIFLFLFAILGNSTYSTSIILKSTNAKIFWKTFPYLLGSAGTLLFDVMIFAQYRYYQRMNEKITLRYHTEAA